MNRKIPLNKKELYRLHWEEELPMLQMAKVLGCSRDTIRRRMIEYNIAYRNLSEDNKRRYTTMTKEEIKEQTKAANNKCRSMVDEGTWILSGKNNPGYKHGLTGTAVYRTMKGKEYEARKLNQSPKLTKLEQNRLNFIYEVAGTMVKYEVDHIQPLSKGGLHHPDNLQILEASLNRSKNNKWPLTAKEKVKYKGHKI